MYPGKKFMSEYEKPHIIVEEGIERGREVRIPENGARIGRAHENDVVFDDPSLSRFQCRLFFKADRLWMADLGSANGSLVNGKEVAEIALKIGDEVIIGEMSFRIVRDTYHGNPAAYPGGEGKPADQEKPAVSAPSVEKLAPAEASDAKSSDSGKEIDLGLGKPKDNVSRKAKDRSGKDPKGKVSAVLWGFVILMVIVAAFAVVYKVSGLGNSAPAKQVEGDTLAIYYEKIEGSDGNVFRYELSLEDGVVKVNIDNVATDQHISEEKKLSKEIVSSLRSSMVNAAYTALDAEYAGLSDDSFRLRDITVVAGNRVNRSKVINRNEPEEFAKVRKLIEDFAETHLGLAALALPPEELRRLAGEANALGHSLYASKNVQSENLWRAYVAFKDVQIHLRTIEPKPDYFDEAVNMERTCRDEIQTYYEGVKYEADRFIQLRDWLEAKDKLQAIRDHIPDTGDERHDAARRKLLEVERNMKR